MDEQPKSVQGERVLQIWNRGDTCFGGRLLNGANRGRRYEGCTSAEGVQALAVAFGAEFDRVEMIDPVDWEDFSDAHRTQRSPDATPDSFEQTLIECILRLNAGQRQRLLGLIAARPLDERVRFIEHCNDLASGVSRTMLDTPGAPSSAK